MKFPLGSLLYHHGYCDYGMSPLVAAPFLRKRELRMILAVMLFAVKISRVPNIIIANCRLEVPEGYREGLKIEILP